MVRMACLAVKVRLEVMTVMEMPESSMLTTGVLR